MVHKKALKGVSSIFGVEGDPSSKASQGYQENHVDDEDADDIENGDLHLHYKV